MSGEPQVICEKKGAAGVITLNRPKALNALTLGMVQDMTRALRSWENDSAVSSVVLKGEGDRAFCAGGDIRSIHTLCREGRHDEALTFFREEYILNATIAHFPKPYVSLIGGIVMGGGVGISAHGSHRVAGDNYLFSMPEVGIGFFPDVGAAHVLSRLPHLFGLYLAVTGDRIRRDDALYLGLATHAVATTDFPVVEQRLVAGEPVDAVLAALSVAGGPSRLAEEAGTVERCFAADSVREIVQRIAGLAPVSEFASHVLSSFDGKSPTSMCVTFEQIRRAAHFGLEEVLRMDYRLASRLTEPGMDFFEGVRAMLIDKDGQPAWNPATLAEVDLAAVEAYFAPLPSELKPD